MRYSPFRHIGSVLRKNNPIHLTFFITRRCNARCPFCFYQGNNPPSPPFDKGGMGGFSANELTLSEIKEISSSMGKLLWLAFSGGEIFLRDDLVEIAKVFYEKNRPAIILFPTNGLLTDTIREKTEEILKYCRKSTIVVKLSLEGAENIHDSIRGIKGGFQKTMRTYNALSGLIEKYPHFELGINTVFCSSNQDHMSNLIESVGKLDKIKTHTISLIRGKVSDKTLKDIDFTKYLETIKKLESNLKEKKSGIYGFRGAKLKAAQDIVQRRLIHETMHQKKQLIPCYAGRLNLVLTESGDLYPCESFDMKMGNVRDNGYNIKKILQTEKAQEIINKIQDKKCRCTHECFFMTNILFNPRMYPALLKEYLQL